MRKIMLFLLLSLHFTCGLRAQECLPARNVILVTFDGLRWQEVFTGADRRLIHDPKFVSDTADLVSRYWSNDPEERRRMLMPFLWGTVAAEGQIYGNRKFRNKVNTTNMFWFSYPGYNEILTGIKNDKKVFTNQKKYNPNVTVLEYLNSLPSFHNRVAVFGSWDVFPYIINGPRSSVFINAGYAPMQLSPMNDQEKLLDEMQDELPTLWESVRLDAITYHLALEYMKSKAPRVMEISFGETDDIAHDGEYDGYLAAINRTDAFIRDLWAFVQSNENYRDKTTIIITTDHGRGYLFRNSWEKHGRGTPGSGQTWFAVLGPDTRPLGEVKTNGQFYQNQFASTIAAFLNVDYTNAQGCGAAMVQVMQKNTEEKPRMIGMLKKPPMALIR